MPLGGIIAALISCQSASQPGNREMHQFITKNWKYYLKKIKIFKIIASLIIKQVKILLKLSSKEMLNLQQEVNLICTTKVKKRLVKLLGTMIKKI